ncbi:tryptophan--tRNA ligase, partial [Clostridium perfringens]
HQIANSSELDRILMDGAKRASETAVSTLLAAKKAMGLVTF